MHTDSTVILFQGVALAAVFRFGHGLGFRIGLEDGMASKNAKSPPIKKHVGPAKTNRENQPVNWETLFSGTVGGNTIIECGANRTIFSQGQPADSVFYLRLGKVKLSVTSEQGLT